jgi:ABC-type branched-subunit amino acid transport system ATPase component
MAPPLLSVRGLTRRFGGVSAVDGLDFEVAQGEFVSLIGPNGAGKTTTFNLISGLDEPTMGLSPLWVDRVLELIAAINKQGATIFMVEQNANLALQIAHDAYVLQTGRIVLEGPASELRADPRIRDAYLGGAAAA